MGRNRKPRRWSVADRVSVVVVLGAAVIVALGWRVSGVGDAHQETSGGRMIGVLAAEPCGTSCTPSLVVGLSGDPATGMPYPH